MSREVWEAILRAPASDPVKANWPAVVTYSEYFSWPPERRSAAPRSLRDIPRDYRWQLSNAIALLFGYMLAVTYVFKLIPLYAGYQGRGSLRDIAALYLSRFHILSANLNSVALGPAPLIFALTFGGILLILALEVLLVRGILASCARYSSYSAPGPRPSSSARCY